jgi:hypothetical protein
MKNIKILSLLVITKKIETYMASCIINNIKPNNYANQTDKYFKFIPQGWSEDLRLVFLYFERIISGYKVLETNLIVCINILKNNCNFYLLISLLRTYCYNILWGSYTAYNTNKPSCTVSL